MAGRKRAASTSSGDSSSSSDKRQKRLISVVTFSKWQSLYNREHQSLLWLHCDKDPVAKSSVSTLWCEVCRKYESSITGLKYFSRVWIDGSSNHRVSNVLDHAVSNQHKAAMARFNKDCGKGSKASSLTSPIVRSMLKIDPTTRARLSKKFDVCYLLAKEGLSFKKYPKILELESRHEVDIGFAYINDNSAQAFIHYIAESQREIFLKSFSDKNFFSVLMDGTTDSGNLEEELIVILYCSKVESCCEVKTCARYLSVENPERATAEGLTLCLGNCLKNVGIDCIKDVDEVLKKRPIIVGGGTDGASVNIAQHRSIKQELQSALPWLFWSWCYAHRLELAAKNSLTSSIFKKIDEMLLRMYYLYEKSPKKARELVSVVEDLKEVFEFPRGGNIPVRAQGSRWIVHKRRALQRIVDRYGAYISHLTALSIDKSLKSEDRARLTGYLRNWSDAKILVGCSLYIEVLKPPTLLSLSLQNSDLDIVFGVKQILKTIDCLKTLKQSDPLEWPTVKQVLQNIKEEEDGQAIYQGATLRNYNSTSMERSKREALSDMTSLEENLRHRLEWSDVTLLRSLLVFVETQSWMKRSSSESDEDASMIEIKKALEHLFKAFQQPLQSQNVNLLTVQDEIEDAVEYARTYISLESTTYRKVWYLLHTCPDSGKWPSVLLMCELVFSLPFSNGRLEQMFSSLKLIKSANRTSLKTATLNDLLEVNLEGPPLSEFSSAEAIDLWWKSCKTTRRPNQSKRKPYRSRSDGAAEVDTSTSSGDPDSLENTTVLDDWDQLF